MKSAGHMPRIAHPPGTQLRPMIVLTAQLARVQLSRRSVIRPLNSVLTACCIVQVTVTA